MRTTYLILLAFNGLPSLHVHTPPLFQVEREKEGWEYVDMLWCQGAQYIGVSNRKLKPALQCTV